MNNNIKILIGAGIGAGIGWFVGAVIAEMIALKSFDYENCEEYQDHYKDVPEEYTVLERNSTKVSKREKSKDYTKSFKSLQELASKYGMNVVTPDPNDETIKGMTPDYTIEDELFEIDDSPKDIEIISFAEYANDPEGFEAVTLHYYDDDVVTDEKDNPISRPEQLIGDEALVSFGELSDDEDVVYIRNTPKRALYEVVRLNRVYASSPSRAKARDRIDKMGEEEENGEASSNSS